VGVYPYPDESGAEVLRVYRYEQPTSTRYQVWTGGEWRWDNRAGARTHLLYRLPHVLDAVHAGERVYLVDSEASADALFKAGVVATAIAGKPGAQLRTSHIEWLRDGYVTIVARRDHAGRDHARLFRAALAEVAAEVEVVEPQVNRPHATAADHLAAGLGLDDFAPWASSRARRARRASSRGGPRFLARSPCRPAGPWPRSRRRSASITSTATWWRYGRPWPATPPTCTWRPTRCGSGW
jgi:hypothetical protein